MTEPTTEAGPYPRDNVQEYRKTATVMAGQAPTGGIIPTLEGDHTYEAGDYIAGPGAAGEYWPVRRDIFETTYAPAIEAEARATVPDCTAVQASLDAMTEDYNALSDDHDKCATVPDVDVLWSVLAGIGVISNGTWVAFTREDAQSIAETYAILAAEEGTYSDTGPVGERVSAIPVGDRLTPAEALALLSPRQLDIFRVLATGATYEETARQLGVSRTTVHKHGQMGREAVGAETTIELFVIVGWLVAT